MINQLLFTLTPKTGFYKANNEMAYLDGAITAYHPSNVEEPNGYVYFTFYEDGSTENQHVRLWSTANRDQKLCAEFDIQTTSPEDIHDFFFYDAQKGGGYQFLKKISVVGAKREILKIEFFTQESGDSLIRMYATKKIHDGYVFILRKIDIFQSS